ncbi:unnamed protein product, partial [Didymodactylos carnosus]
MMRANVDGVVGSTAFQGSEPFLADDDMIKLKSEPCWTRINKSIAVVVRFVVVAVLADDVRFGSMAIFSNPGVEVS